MMRIDRTEMWLLASGLGLALGAFVLPSWLTFLLTIAFAKGLVVQGVVIQMRAGLVSFGQGLYYCIGGYTVGMGGQMFGLHDVSVLLPLAMVVAALVALVLGLLLTRYREIFFAMLTLAFSMILFGVLAKSQSLGSTDGFNVPAVTALGWHPGTSGKMFVYVLTCGCASVAAVLLHRLSKSSIGFVCESIRENEVRVEYLGVSPRWVLYATYVLAAATSALGGGLTGMATGHVDPEMAYWTTSGEFVFIALLGGISHVAAPFLAASLFSTVRTYAIQFVPHSWQMILGFVLLGIIIFLPKGLWSLFQKAKVEARA
jgi:ABC-type branched-subunit amino acid transport system permease subunit